MMEMVFNATYPPPVAARERKSSVYYEPARGETLMVAEDTIPYGKSGV